MVIPDRSLFNSSSLRMASCKWHGMNLVFLLSRTPANTLHLLPVRQQRQHPRTNSGSCCPWLPLICMMWCEIIAECESEQILCRKKNSSTHHRNLIVLIRTVFVITWIDRSSHAFFSVFLDSKTAWMLRRTPPWAMVTPDRSLFSASSLRTASCKWHGMILVYLLSRAPPNTLLIRQQRLDGPTVPSSFLLTFCNWWRLGC